MDFCRYISEIDNVDVQCDLKTGWENVGYIVNRSDIDFSDVEYGFTSEQTIYPKTFVTKFSLKDGAKGKYIAQLKNSFNETTTSLEVKDFRNTFTKNVSFTIFNDGADTAKIVNGLANGEFVVIIESKNKNAGSEKYGDGCSAFHIYGLENGLVASSIEKNIENGGWNVSLEETNGSNSDYFLFISNDDVPTYQNTLDCIKSAFETL